MLKVQYKKHFIKLEHRWFASAEELAEKSDADVIYMHGVEPESVPATAFSGEQKTLIKDLTLPEEALFLTLGKHLRAYIKRSMKENVQIRMIDSPELLDNREHMENAAKLYEKMYMDKGIKAAFNRTLAEQYAAQNALCIAAAYIQGVMVGFDAVIYQGSQARLWLAAFDFRNESEDAQLLSRAHQRMDWELLLWCKERGIVDFDFGGVTSFENPNGIDSFKLKFEKDNRVIYHNAVVPNSLLGTAVVWALKWKRMLKK